MQTARKFRVGGLVSLCCLFAMLLAACGGNAAPNGNTSGNNPALAPADKQVLREVNEGGDFDSLDPALTQGNGEPINLLFTGLVGPRDDGTVGDQLAASHQVSADRLTYTFTLKSGLKFSDGTPLTADDVAYSINRALLPATKSTTTVYLQLIKDYDKITGGKIPTLIGDSLIVKDPTTISIIISKPAAYFLQALAYPTSYVVEKKVAEKYGASWTDHLQEGGGDGPFKVASYGHTTNLTVVPNTNYYNAQPKIQKIIYTIGSDRDSNYKAYKAGQYDAAPVPPSQDPIAKALPGFQHTPALASRFIGMNYLAKPFDNIKIRQAFALAMNKDLVINHVLGPDVVTPSNHIVLDGIPGYNPNLTGPAGVKGTTGDQAKAQQLFKEGLQEGGYSSASALPSITLTYNSAYKAGADTMTSFAAQWKEVLGVNVKLVGVQPNDLLKQESDTVGHAGPLQMWYGNWGADYPDPQDWLSLFFGKTDHNSFNYGQNTSPAAAEQQAVQAQLNQADGEQDNTKRMALYQDAEQKIVNDVGWITTYQSSYFYSVNPKLHGWKLTPLGVQATDDWANIYFVQ